MADEYQVFRNDVLLPVVTIQVVNADEGLDALLRLNRNCISLGKRIECSDTMDSLRAQRLTQPNAHYLRELLRMTGDLVRKSDPAWTADMCGKLWEEMAWMLCDYFFPPTRAVASATTETDSQSATSPATKTVSASPPASEQAPEGRPRGRRMSAVS